MPATSDGKQRPGTGKVVKFMRNGKEPLTKIMGEVNDLSDKDLGHLVKGLTDETYSY